MRSWPLLEKRKAFNKSNSYCNPLKVSTYIVIWLKVLESCTALLLLFVLVPCYLVYVKNSLYMYVFLYGTNK